MYASTKYRSLLNLAFLGVLAYYSTQITACVCKPNHPQNIYCSADYVVVVLVLDNSTNLLGNLFEYKVEIKRVYKITYEWRKSLETGSLFGPVDENYLKVGKLYVIAGQGSISSMFSYFKEYEKMSIIEREGFSGMFELACNCEVANCFNESCNENAETRFGCKWPAFDKCANEFSVCEPVFNYTTEEKDFQQCRWRKSPLYNRCISTL